jgi:hypothetical protein
MSHMLVEPEPRIHVVNGADKRDPSRSWMPASWALCRLADAPRWLVDDDGTLRERPQAGELFFKSCRAPSFRSKRFRAHAWAAFKMPQVLAVLGPRVLLPYSVIAWRVFKYDIIDDFASLDGASLRVAQGLIETSERRGLPPLPSVLCRRVNISRTAS